MINKLYFLNYLICICDFDLWSLDFVCVPPFRFIQNALKYLNYIWKYEMQNWTLNIELKMHNLKKKCK